MNPDATQPQPVTPAEPPKSDPVLDAIKELRESVDQRFAEYDERLTNTTEQITEAVTPVEPEPEKPGWKPNSWDEFPQLAESKAEEVARRILAEQADAAKKTQDDQRAAEIQTQQSIDKQLEELTKTGVLPTVTTATDPNDPGVAARQELLALCVHLGTPDIPKVAEAVQKYHEAGLSFDPTTKQFLRSNPQMPGKYVPVGSSSARGTATSNTPLSYEQLHKMSMDQIIEAGQRMS